MICLFHSWCSTTISFGLCHLARCNSRVNMDRTWHWYPPLSLYQPYLQSSFICLQSDRLSLVLRLARLRDNPPLLFFQIKTLYTLRRFPTVLLLLSLILSSCGSSSTPIVVPVQPTE